MAGITKVEEYPCVLGPRTMVLVGRTGNGKSATGNSILGVKAFESKRSSEGVTRTTECQSMTLRNGQVLNVIDTPGLFSNSVGSEDISQEIVKCLGLASDGIHTVLLVYSIKSRFSEEEEEAVFDTLLTFFGPKIKDYVVVIFTGADELEEDESLEDCFGQTLPKPVLKIVEACRNRYVLFDNRTKDEKKKELQFQQLMSLVENVMMVNECRPYTNDFFAEYKETAMLEQKKEEVKTSQENTKQELTELTEKLQKSHYEQLKHVTEMVEENMKLTNEMPMKKLGEANTARLKAEKVASDALRKAQNSAMEVQEWKGRACYAERSPPLCSIM